MTTPLPFPCLTMKDTRLDVKKEKAHGLKWGKGKTLYGHRNGNAAVSPRNRQGPCLALNRKGQWLPINETSLISPPWKRRDYCATVDETRLMSRHEMGQGSCPTMDETRLTSSWGRGKGHVRGQRLSPLLSAVMKSTLTVYCADGFS